VTGRGVGKRLDDPTGRKNVLIGLCGIAATIIFGLPALLVLVHSASSDEIVPDTRWTGPVELSGGDQWDDPAVMALGGGQRVVAGSSGVGVRQPAIWYSEDGHAWSPATVVPDPTGDTTSAAIESAIYDRGRWLAVGHADAFGHTDAAIWSSTDAATWERVAIGDDRLGGPGTQAIVDVATDESELVAVGYENFGGDANGVVWTSVDGVNWERATDAGTAFSGPGDQVPSTIVHLANGSWVAGGREDIADHSDAAAWSSADGRTWHRVASPDFGGARDDAIYAMTASPEGAIAVGASRLEESTDAVVWTTSTGTSWSRVPFNRTIFGGPFDQRMDDVVRSAGSFYAVGADERNDVSTPAVWVSVEGRHWRRVESDAFVSETAARLVGCSADDIAVTCVGVRDTGSGRRSEIWRRDSP
jgi:hypothetical protein